MEEDERRSTLHWACYEDDEDAIARLIEKEGADVNQPKPRSKFYYSLGESPFYIACEYSSDSVVDLLIQNHADINQVAHGNGATPLYGACEAGRSDDDVIQLLIDLGANVNHTRNDGQTPLYIASWNGFWDICSILIRNGAKVDQPKTLHNGWTPLAAACHRGHLKTVQVLVEEGGANVNLAVGNGVTPVYLASEQGHETIVKYLVAERGADIDNVHWKVTYLHDPILQSIQEEYAEQQMNNESDEWSINYVKAYKSRQYGPLEIALENGHWTTANFLKDQESIRDKEREALVALSREKISDYLMLYHEGYPPAELSIHYIRQCCSFDVTIGGGAFGQIFLGTDDDLDIQFAIKRIQLGTSASEEGCAAFTRIRREIMMLNEYRHPNMVRLYGYCSHYNEGTTALNNNNNNPEHYLLYEYYKHGSLDRYLRDDDDNNNQRMVLHGPRRVYLMFEIARSVNFLHSGGIDGREVFHRDLKSANICLSDDFSAKLIDFDTAKIMATPEEQEQKERTLLDTILRTSRYGVFGTPGYICPEYARGLIPFEAGCDIFSIGIVMIELIVGCLQANQSSRNGVQFGDFFRRYKKLKSDELQLQALVKDADPAIEWSEALLSGVCSLALSCIEPDPKDRPKGNQLVESLHLLVQKDDEPMRCDVLPTDVTDNTTISTISNNGGSESIEEPVKRDADGTCHHCNDSSTVVIVCSEGHTTCRRCLSVHVSARLQEEEGFSVTIFCPVIGCSVHGKPFPDDKLKRILVPRLYRKLKQKRSKEKDIQARLKAIEKKAEQQIQEKLDSLGKSLEGQLQSGIDAISLEVKHQGLTTQQIIHERTNQTHNMILDQNRAIKQNQFSLAKFWSHDVQKCPTIVLLEPARPSSSSSTTRKSPTQWAKASIRFARSMLKQKYRLYFICQRTYTAINEYIQIEVTRKWLVKVAPYLKAAILLLRASCTMAGIVLPCGASADGTSILDLDAASIFTDSLMDEDIQDMIVDASQSVIDNDEAVDVGAADGNSSKIKTLTGAAYDLVQKEACKQREAWEKSISCVSNERGEFIWVKKQFEHLY